MSHFSHSLSRIFSLNTFGQYPPPQQGGRGIIKKIHTGPGDTFLGITPPAKSMYIIPHPALFKYLPLMHPILPVFFLLWIHFTVLTSIFPLSFLFFPFSSKFHPFHFPYLVFFPPNTITEGGQGYYQTFSPLPWWDSFGYFTFFFIRE